MRPAEYTPEEIIQAGQDLQAGGRNVTGFALRSRVGGGNPNRLKQVWDEHLAKSAVTHTEPVAELPIEVAEQVMAVTKALTDRLASLAVDLNDKAVKAAERRVSEVVRAAGEQREQAERELVDAATTVDELESAMEVAQAEIASRDTRIAKLSSDLQAQAVELASVQSEAKHLQAELVASKADLDAEKRQRAEDIERRQMETDQLRGELATARAKAESDHAALIEAKVELKSVRADLVECRDAMAQAQQAAATSGARAEEITKRAEGLTSELDRIAKQNADLVLTLAEAAKQPATRAPGNSKGSRKPDPDTSA